MSRLFFDQLVVREEIDIELDSYALSPEDREELLQIIDEMLIHHVLNVVLNQLPKEKHEEFITKLHSAPHDEKLLEYLRTHTHPNIEDDIVKQANKIKKEIISEIKKSRHK